MGANGRPVDRAALFRKAEVFREGVATYLDFSVHVTACELTGGAASATARLSWQGLKARTMEKVTGHCGASVEMRKDSAGGWSVMEFGWEGDTDGAMRS